MSNNRVSRRQANRYAQKDQEQAEEQQQQQDNGSQQDEPGAQDDARELRRIRRWVTSSSNSVIWKAQGVLSDGEFTAAKAKILGI